MDSISMSAAGEASEAISANDTRAIKSLLNKSFFNAISHLLKIKNWSNSFKGTSQELFEIIAEQHTASENELNDDFSLEPDDLYELWKCKYPAATAAEKREVREFLEDVREAKPYPVSVASKVFHALLKREAGRKIATFGIHLSEGYSDAFQQLTDFLQESTGAITGTSFDENELYSETTKDIDELLQVYDDKNRFKFNIKALDEAVPGIGRQEFGVIFATPETGKTAFIVSICCAPNGFCYQGAKVLYLGNEESTKRTMLRAIQACSGMTRDEVRADPDTAASYFAAIRNNIIMKDIQEMSLEEVEQVISRYEPDVVILDQADKVSISGKYDATHERLRVLYMRLRELAKKHDCALLAVSQASNDAAGRTRLSPHMLEGSKIGKFAEADLIIGIGKQESTSLQDEDHTRYLTIGKNKISGAHPTVLAMIRPHISRYVD